MIAVTDGLNGMEEALAAASPQTTLQTCIVPLLRQRLDFASWPQRQPLAIALRTIDTAPRAAAAVDALEAFARGEWGRRFPTVVAAWRRAWPRILPFVAFPPEIRRVIDTTNARERVPAPRRTTITTRGQCPTDASATTLIWLARRHIPQTGSRAAPTWRQAMNHFAMLYDGRFQKCVDDSRAWTRPSLWTRRRAHRDLDNRRQRGFPQRPHASSFVRTEDEEQFV